MSTNIPSLTNYLKQSTVRMSVLLTRLANGLCLHSPFKRSTNLLTVYGHLLAKLFFSNGAFYTPENKPNVSFNMQPDSPLSDDPNGGTLNSRLSQFWKLLAVQAYSLGDTNSAFNTWHDEVWRSFDCRGNKEHIGMEDLYTLDQRLKAWKDWRYSDASSMLVLAGHNNDVSSNNGWISPVAVRVVKTIREEREKQQALPDRPTWAFYQWKYGYMSGLRPKPPLTVPDMLRHVLAQLVDQNKHVLEDDGAYGRICQALEGIAEAVQASKQATESKHTSAYESSRKAIEHAVLGVVGELGKDRTTWIVLDRLDEGKPNRTLGLQVLANLVKKAHVTVKVLVVTNFLDWGTSCKKEVNELAKDAKGNIVFFEWSEENRDLF